MIDFKTFITENGEGLWANIHKKRKSGRPMRKKGEKGAPTDDAIKRAQEASDFVLTPARENFSSRECRSTSLTPGWL